MDASFRMRVEPMHAIVIDRLGAGADGLSLAERAVPVPGPSQVLKPADHRRHS